jgi:hypothetical protein
VQIVASYNLGFMLLLLVLNAVVVGLRSQLSAVSAQEARVFIQISVVTVRLVVTRG